MKKSPSSRRASRPLDLRALIISSLEDGKAKDIVTIPLQGKTDIADYMIIASGTSDKHSSSLGAHVLKNVKTALNDPSTPVYAEGLTDGNWVLIDTGAIIVHIFKPGTRELYNLEGMWSAPAFEEQHATVY